jgi:trehalose/maltose hydrolase-like predicted phosphorylase
MTRREVLAAAAGAMAAGRLRGALPVMGTSGGAVAGEPAYLSNGMIGIRPGALAVTGAPAYAAGYVYEHPVHRVECLAPAPYPLGAEIRVNGWSLLDAPGRGVARSQKIDFATGALETEFDFAGGGGAKARVRVLQFASRSLPSVLCQRVELLADAGVKLGYAPRILFDAAAGTVVEGGLPPGAEADAAAEVTASNGKSRVGLAVRVAPGGGWKRVEGLGGWEADARPGEALVMETIASMAPSFYHPEPGLQAVRMANWGLQTGFDRLWQENKRLWGELWRSRVEIDGPAADQRALDAAFFYLHSSVHRSNLNGMPPFGLSQSEHYYGHSFWDTETWSFLPVLLAAPDAARSLLEFRVRGMEWARRDAALFGYRGIQFPWEAAPIGGDEVTPVFAATGWAEQHVVPDVALAFWQYQKATGDADFLRRGTWPVLSGVAEWILSRGERTSRGFEITNVMGPNENEDKVTNSAYVNIACKMALEAAVGCARLVGETAPAEWAEAARGMVLPIDGRGMLVTSEGSKRNAFADVSFLYVMEPPVDEAVMKRTYTEFRRAPREHGIGFATASQAAMAAGVGDRGAAAELFRAAWEPFWLEPFGMIREAAQQGYACFVTDEGSLLQAAMLGFTGLRVREGDWAAREATLPEGWKGMRIGRIFVRGQAMKVEVEHGQRARVTAG